MDNQGENLSPSDKLNTPELNKLLAAHTQQIKSAGIDASYLTAAERQYAGDTAAMQRSVELTAQEDQPLEVFVNTDTDGQTETLFLRRIDSSNNELTDTVKGVKSEPLDEDATEDEVLEHHELTDATTAVMVAEIDKANGQIVHQDHAFTNQQIKVLLKQVEELRAANLLTEIN